jgi:hypothetical protein
MKDPDFATFKELALTMDAKCEYRVDKEGFVPFVFRKVGGAFLKIGYLIHDVGCFKIIVDNRGKNTS